RLVVWGAVRDHVQEGGALLLTTHQLEEADALADRLVLFEHGQGVAGGPLAALEAGVGRALLCFRAPPGPGSGVGQWGGAQVGGPSGRARTCASWHGTVEARSSGSSVAASA